MPRSVSLHIGINLGDPAYYRGVEALVACENDARTMESIAAAAGFEEREFLMGKNASVANVKERVSAAASAMEPGDIFLLTYAGHGGFVPAEVGGDENDGMDETWSLYDRQLIDNELWDLWARFNEEVRILVVLDSCHSGSAVWLSAMHSQPSSSASAAPPQAVLESRLDQGTSAVRSLPMESLSDILKSDGETYKRLLTEFPRPSEVTLNASIILLSACQDWQTTGESEENGNFTAALRGVWAGGAFKGNYLQFHAAIAKRLKPQLPGFYKRPPVIPAFEAQSPFEVPPPGSWP